MSTNAPQPVQGTLGTFGGVFTPSILTILGLVLFLLVPFVVGSVGLFQALLILGLSTLVSVLTSISLATVATNIRVGGGGEYYIISRTLGIEFGGAVGVVLYLAISVSIAFYSIGFAEAVVTALGRDSTRMVQLIAAGLVLVIALIAFVGSDLATRLQFFVMFLLVIALLSFLFGSISSFDVSQFTSNIGAPDEASRSEDSVGFWTAFAIFFPAVTGFSQGVAMSGDLRTPSESITRGTFAAVGLSTVVYLVVIVLLAGNSTAMALVDNTNTIISELSIVSWTMLVGVLAATISSALASTLGSPRVLQRLGEDKVLPGLDRFAEGSGPANNPRKALGVSLIIALATVAVGDLNAIAPIISMFFLASYAIINYATYYEFRAGSTAFRPTFRFGGHWASLAGTIACVGAIIAINPVAGALAALVFVALYGYLRRRDVPDRWIDSVGSYHYNRARNHLQAHSIEPRPARDWRPCALAFVPRDPHARKRMLTMSSWLEGDSGFLTAVRVIEGRGPVKRQEAAAVELELIEEVHEVAPGGFARAVVSADPAAGVQTLVQAHGLGRVRPNLTLFGVHDLRGSDEERNVYGEMLQSCVRFGTNVAVLDVNQADWRRFEDTPRKEREIALWWSDDQAGQLTSLLAWLIERHEEWSEAKMIAYVPDADAAELERVSGILKAGRINAEVKRVDANPASLTTALGAATLALAPLRVRRGSALGPYETPLGMLVESLPLGILVLAIEEIALNAEPDESDLAEIARLSDQLAKLERKTSELDVEAGRLLVAAETIRLEADANPDDVALHEQADHAHEESIKAFRSYVNSRTQCHNLEQDLADMDPSGATTKLHPGIWQSSSARSET